MLYLNSDLLPTHRDGRPLRLPPELPVDVLLYREFRENNGEVKTRLPEVAWNALGTAAEADFRQRPALARDLVFCHLYGRYDLQVMKMHKEGLYYVAPFDDALYCRSVSLRSVGEETSPVGKIAAPLKVLGKSEKELVLAMPSRMETDVKRLARLIGRTPGKTLRMILIRELFGRRFAVEKPRG